MSREDIFDAMLHWRLLRDAGVKIVTAQRGELDFNNLGGVITAIVDQYGAHDESIKLADRVISGKRLAISNGSRQGGALYGYDREILDEQGNVVRRVSFREQFQKSPTWQSRLVVTHDKEALSAVRYMFEAVCQGLSYGSIARELNRRGIRTMFNKRFNSSLVSRIIANPAYVGDLVYGQRRRRGKFRTLFDEGGVVYPNAHEPLVSREVFERAQRAAQTHYKLPKATQNHRYLLSGLLFLADCGRRLNGYALQHPGMSTPRRYYMQAPRYFEEYPDDSNRPSFRADTIEQAVLKKIREYLSDARHKRSIQAAFSQRSQQTKSNVSSWQRRLTELRTKIERGTENLALAQREDIPGISRLLSGWREEESELRQRLVNATREATPSVEELQFITKIDHTLERLSEANREKLVHALRQTIQRITLRREYRHRSHYRITLWDGVIELREDFGLAGQIPLTDDDIPNPGRWHAVVEYLRERNEVVYLKEVAEALGIVRPYASRLLGQAVLSGQVVNLGHQKGWIAAR